MSLALEHSSTLAPTRSSSLRSAALMMALLPAGSASLMLLADLLLAPSAELVAGVAVALFALNAVALPLVLDRRVGSRLTALADALRAARDGRYDRVPNVIDTDAIGDIARLANDIVAAQADIGRYAMSLHNAEEFARISDVALQRLIGGAQQIDRTLAGFQTAVSNVSRSSERIAVSLDAAAIGTDETTRNFVAAASRAIRSAEAIVLSVGRASVTAAQPRIADAPDVRVAPPANDAILSRLDDLAQSIGDLPKAAELRQISEAAAAPVIAKLSGFAEQTADALSGLHQPIAAGRGALEARLDDLQDWLATTPQHSATPPAVAALDLAPLTDAIARLESEITARLSAPTDVTPNPPAAAALDLGPFVDSIDRLERRLIQLTERSAPQSQADPVDLQPVLSGLADITARLATLEMPVAVEAAPHPDAGLVAEFDAARAPLQRLLVAFRLAVRDIGLESGRLRSTIDDIAAPRTETAALQPLDLSPLSEQLEEIASRIGALQAVTQQSIDSRPAHPDAGLVAEFDAAKAPLQRILVGLRLALREIADSSTQFRDAVGQIGAAPAAEMAAVGTPAIDLTPIAAQLDDLTQRFSSLEIAARLAISAPPVLALQDVKLAPQLAIDRTAMSTALTGLKLMMREISADATALRSAAESMPTKGDIVAPEVDLSAITGPLGALREELAAGNGVLAEIYAQMGRDSQAASQSSAIKGDAGIPSLSTTLSLMSAFSSAVETKFDDIEQRIFDVTRRYGTADGRAAAEDLVTQLLEATGELRDQVGRFLAVGAALSREIETAGKEQKSSHADAALPRLSQKNR